MRIAQVNVIYGHGSTGRIVETLHRQYEKLGHESYVLFGRGKKTNDPHVIRTGFLFEAKLWRFIQLFTGNTLNGSPLNTWNLKRKIKKIKPDVVNLHCINGNMCNVFGLLKWLRKHGYKTVLTHHGSFMFTGGCGLCLCDGNKKRCVRCPHPEVFMNKASHRRTKQNYALMGKMRLNEDWIRHIFVSPWSMKYAEGSDFMNGNNMHVVFNPVDTDVFALAGDKYENDKPYVFFPFASKSIGVKGGQFVKPLAEKLDALGYDLVTTDEVGKRGNIIGLGYISNPREMAKVYRGAAATAIMSSVESFSMPVVESILCGTPVAGFKCGAPETIETEGAAIFVPYGNIDALVEAIKSVSKTKTADLSSVYSPEAIADEYLKIYEK